MAVHARIKLKSGETIAEYHTDVSGDHAAEIRLVDGDSVKRIDDDGPRGPGKQKIREETAEFLASIDHEHAGANLLVIRE